VRVFSSKVRRSEVSNLDFQKMQEIYIHIWVKPALEHDRFPMTWDGESFSLGLMRLSSGASQNLPSVAEVKNECSYMLNLPFAFVSCLETNCAQCIVL